METISSIDLGIAGSGRVYRNLPVPQLVEKALERGEGKLTDTGALAIITGKYTGRSPKDKFIVDTPAVHDEIHWGSVNFPISREKFSAIRAKMLAYLQNRELFVFDGFAGADPKVTKRFRIVNEFASQNLFMHQLLIRPSEEQLKGFTPDYTMYCAPGFQCIPEIDGVNSECAILLDLEAREVLIAGNQYSGEMKKSVFTVMNYILPKMGVLPMHCSANMGADGNTAVFLGLSGTGKTTLSADPARSLIGDDEHGWTADGVFNIEGGCYAKCIGLKRENEPEIYDAIRFGSMLENVITDENGHPDYEDGSLTENTRAGYPIEYIGNAAIPGVGGNPSTVVFLTADAFGVLPPISRLNQNAAAYYFVSGYTSKLAGTERGIKEPVTTFSSMFGEPFFPMRPSVYANMFIDKLQATGAQVFLVNTGWCGGKAGDVPRMKLRFTRAMVEAAISGQLNDVEYEHDPIFGVDIPKSCPNVPDEILDPRNLWQDKAAYAESARKLAQAFVDNMEEKEPEMDEKIKAAGPRV